MPADHLPEHRAPITTGVARTDTPNLAEREGFGHPDTLADQLAKDLSCVRLPNKCSNAADPCGTL